MTGKYYKTNQFIRAEKLRVIDEEGKQIGVISLEEALKLARDSENDLVEIAPMANPPVCKIMDFGKYQYQQSRQERLSKAKQKKVDIKGIRIGFRTDTHDLDFKKNQAEKFLKKGDKVKVEIRLRGREKAHMDLARNNLVEFLKSIGIPYKMEQEIKRFPGGLNVIITPE